MVDVHPEERLRRLGLMLPPPPQPLAHYAQSVRVGSLLYLAGHAPLRDGQHQYVGKVGREWTIEQGYGAARLTALNMLATLKAGLGDLGRVRRVVKLFGMVNCTEDFTRLPEVIDGASDLFVAIFVDAGRSARSAAGMQQLHFGMAIEVEGIVEIADEAGG
jgi:enamine deaminase RidA (YjgF/YER057c/UK114 family)